MTALPGQTLYYLSDYSDEVNPCAPTLEAWAGWLAGPHDGSWGLDEAPADGTTFDIEAMTLRADIIAVRGPDGAWSFSASVGDADFIAARWGEGLGWDADSVLWGESLEQAMRDYVEDTEYVSEDEDRIVFAVAKSEPALIGTFRLGPPPSLELATKQ